MKNWKTTFAGIIIGFPVLVDALMQAYTSGYFTDKSGWQLVASALWIALGVYLKDKKSSTTAKDGGDVLPNKGL